MNFIQLAWRLLFGLCLVSILVFVHVSRLPRGRLVVDFLDIGQGDAILMTAPDGFQILFDGGPGQTVLQELGEVMSPLDRRIDLVVVSHPHADHIMGLIQVLRRYEVGAVLMVGIDYSSALYSTLLHEIRTQNIPWLDARADFDWTFGALELDVLYPFQSMSGQAISNVNNATAVVRLTYGEHTFLFTGDIEHDIEAQLVEAAQRNELILKSDVLKVPHHGSRSSSTWEFLEAVSPEVAVMQVGRDNPFGHPHEEVVERYEALDIELHRNDIEGRVRMVFE